MCALCIASQNIAVRSCNFRLHPPNLHVHVRTSHCFANYCSPKFQLPTASPQLARACSHFALLRKLLQSEVPTSDCISSTCTCIFALRTASQIIAVRRFPFRPHLPNLHVHVRTSHGLVFQLAVETFQLPVEKSTPTTSR